MSFAWFRRRRTARLEDEIAEKVRPVWLSVEDRLAQIAKSQAELNKQATEIKVITTSIVTALDHPDEAAQVLKELTPLLKEIPRLLVGLPSALKSMEDQFVVITQGQNQLRKEIDHLQKLISNASDQMSSSPL